MSVRSSRCSHRRSSSTRPLPESSPGAGDAQATRWRRAGDALATRRRRAGDALGKELAQHRTYQRVSDLRGVFAWLARGMHGHASMMQTATPQEFQELLGDIDPLAIERIIDTHASLDEVAEALADVERERSLGERRMPSSTRVAAVREILEDVLDEDIQEDRGMGFGSKL